PKRPGEHFDSEWGGVGAHCSRTTGPWCEYSYEGVENEIMRRAGVSDLTPVNEAAERAGEAFEAAREDIIPALDAVVSIREDATERKNCGQDVRYDLHRPRRLVSLARFEGFPSGPPGPSVGGIQQRADGRKNN